MALAPPNGLMEVVFSFDTTGSMYSCLEQVRGRVKDMIQRLQADLPGIRTAVFAHGDYCDISTTYVTKWIDFTNNVAELCDFVTNVERTGGGDCPECYELVLHQTRTKLSWTFGSRRVLVLIGDDEPHGPDYPQNKGKIDWKKEVKELAMGGVTIYPVQCGGGQSATAFYKTLATVTGGKHLKLTDFGNIFDVLMAVCYREGNDTAMLASYEKEVRARNGAVTIGKDIDAIFASLRDGDVTDTDTALPTASPATTAYTAPMPALKKTTSLTKIKSPKVKTLATKLPMKSPLRRKSTEKPRASSKKASYLDMYRQENLPKLRRENVPEINFGLRSLTWSPWTLVLSPEVPENKEADWEKRRGMPGYRLKYLHSKKPIRNSDRKVLYEVSVKTPGSGKQRHVVYSGFSTRCLQNSRWEASLLRHVRHQLNKLLSGSCKIFLRFYQLSGREDMGDLRRSVKRYDYAWKSIRNERKQPRTATKGAHQISYPVC